jgi:hypothetical protein
VENWDPTNVYGLADVQQNRYRIIPLEECGTRMLVYTDCGQICNKIIAKLSTGGDGALRYHCTGVY